MVLSLLTGVQQASGCPYLRQQQQQQKQENVNMHRKLQTRNKLGDGGIPQEGYSAVKEDIKTILTDSKEFFPADFDNGVGPNYGGLMIRLAWHCSGSYRESDGRGGCDGARIRFDPELNWDDNANLNNARKLLEPIKDKYGSDLSWGDLIILAGNAAIESMGGHIHGFCGGRIDDIDGGDSLILGPSDEQEAISPCQSFEATMQGKCNLVEGSPIGPTTVGLIYVNPAGPEGSEGDPVASGADIRRAFGNMGFNDTETVSLVGGGHAFGKCHGACVSPPCGEGTEMEGIGHNTFTSGFEGAWTTTPTTWNNEYYQSLFDYEWEKITGPGGKIQWEPKNADGTNGPDIMMLTSDIAMAKDSMYNPISKAYGADLDLLNKDFGYAWYKLTSADMGPSSRCLGKEVLPPQSFQNPLPAVTATTGATIDYVPVRTKIQEIVDADSANGPAFVNLAYRCASTYRDTDYKGGCNGARIRFVPEKDWEANAGTQDALETLAPIKESYPEVSMADIIVLAAQTAIESPGHHARMAMAFCGGRVDAEDANGSDMLAPRKYFPTVVSVRDDMQVKGLTAREGVALAGRDSLSNKFFKDLEKSKAGEGDGDSEEEGDESDFSAEELALMDDDEFSAIVTEYAHDPDTFYTEFQMAWTKMMVADRFAGSLDNACTGVNDQTLAVEQRA
jgi:catalase-peroxidase